MHAERSLLEQWPHPVEPGDVLYVNLEPCCHSGKTPACTDILHMRSVKTVVYGMRDPDERVSGKGIGMLKAQGINVIGPMLEKECATLNRGFVSVRTKHRPFITLKKARTSTGAIAYPDGAPRKITSLEQDHWAHTELRSTHDAILIGVGTVMTDNPRLDTRFDELKRGYQPWRIVLDPQLRIPRDATLVTDDVRKSTIIVTDPSMLPQAGELQAAGIRVFGVEQRKGVFVWESLWQALCVPHGAYEGLTSILVEGGRRTWERFRADDMVDEEVELVEESRL